MLVQAKGILNPLSAGEARHPITWKARAWLGRVMEETDTTDKAHAKYQEVRNSPEIAAADGKRLVRYFTLRLIQEKPRQEDTKAPGGANNTVINLGRIWRRDYWRQARPLPAGKGVAAKICKLRIATRVA